MILSFHPCFEADNNAICAGRNPGANELAAIKAADAVILPQGCRKSLYEMAVDNCPNVFPNYDARFKYLGKIGQIKLFRETMVSHPKTETFRTVEAFSDFYGKWPSRHPFSFPFVFKFDWGGEGDTVYLIKSSTEVENILQKTMAFEKTGQKGFLIQEYIPSQSRTLRIVVIGQKIVSYWRVQKNTECFYSSLAAGADIDPFSDPDLQDAAISYTKDFCKKTGINLAGFDFLFKSDAKIKEPLFLEINYFFGRHGLGGSEKFYALLNEEIKRWIDSVGLSLDD